jgi:translation initiation factor IF-1
MAQTSVNTVVTIREKLKPLVYSAALPNGKIITAFVPSEDEERIGQFQPGDIATVQLALYDFSAGMIIDRPTE